MITSLSHAKSIVHLYPKSDAKPLRPVTYTLILILIIYYMAPGHVNVKYDLIVYLEY